MNLIDRIFGRKIQPSQNPSSAWVADASARLSVDLATVNFCGVGLGDPIDRLSRIGPSAGCKVSSDETTLTYGAQGFTVFVDSANRLEGVDFNLLDDSDMAAFAGNWTYAGAAGGDNERHDPRGDQRAHGPGG